MKIAVIGTGVLGTGVALTLLRHGHEVVVHNRTAATAQPLVEAGARWGATPAEATRGASHVILLVWDERALESMLQGPDGLLASARAGQVFIDMSTQLPGTARRTAAALAERGARFVDAPVHGSKAEAHAGGLWIMAGADADTWALALPLLQQVGATVHHMGPVGAGCAAKLCGNHLVSAIVAALAESLVMARRSGIDAEELLDVWAEGDFRSPIVEGAGRAMLRDQHGVSFHLRTMVKDTELIRNHSESIGVPVLISNTVHELFKVAGNMGWGELNATAIVKLFEAMAGLGTPASGGTGPA